MRFITLTYAYDGSEISVRPENIILFRERHNGSTIWLTTGDTIDIMESPKFLGEMFRYLEKSKATQNETE